MEYTKDMVFKVRYDEVNNILTSGKRRTSSIFRTIKKHKFIATIIISAIIFISIDMVLVANFLKILATL